MMKYLLASILLASFISLTIQGDVQKYKECLKVEAVSNLSGLVLDLYYGKTSIPKFFEAFNEWSLRQDISSLTKCFVEGSLDISVFKSALSKVGLTLLYASNCEKDLGPAIMILDNVITSLENIKTQWKQAITNTLIFGLVGAQSYKDCKGSFEAIKNIWS